MPFLPPRAFYRLLGVVVGSQVISPPSSPCERPQADDVAFQGDWWLNALPIAHVAF
jgi:hypothetical protein